MLPVLRLSSGPPVHRGTIAGRAAVTSYDLWIRSEIVEVAAARDVWVISDECYLYFAYPPALPFTAGQLPEELRSRVMICGSDRRSLKSLPRATCGSSAMNATCTSPILRPSRSPRDNCRKSCGHEL